MRLFLFIYTYFFLCFLNPIKAQNTWVSFGDTLITEDAKDLCIDEYGNIYLLGQTDDPNLNEGDFKIIKLNKNANEIWSKSFGHSFHDMPSGIHYRYGHLFISSTSTSGTKNFPSLHVIDTTGILKWQKDYEAPGDTLINLNHSVISNSGNIVITGTCFIPSQTHSNVYVAKINSNGKLLWQYFGNDSTAAVGNASAILQNNDIAITCDIERNLHATLGAKLLSPQGKLLWDTTIENGRNRGSKNLIINQRDQIVIAGEGETPSSIYFDISLTTLSHNGKLISDIFMPGSNKSDAPFGIDQLENGHYILTGYTINTLTGNSEMFITEVDSLGAIIQQQKYCSSTLCIGYAIKHFGKNNYIALGSSLDNPQNFLLSYNNLQGLNLNEHTNTIASIFPNPIISGNFLNINLGKKTIKNIQCYNLNGKLITEYQPKIKSSSYIFPFNYKGFYVIKIIDTNTKEYIQSLIAL